jgi:hypothetical protein
MAVQIVHSSRRGSRDIEHSGFAHDDAELEMLKAVARQRLHAGLGEFDLDLGEATESSDRALEIVSPRMGHLWGALSRAYNVLGFDQASDGDEVFRALVLGRVIEPTSRLDSWRVLAGAGITPPSYPRSSVGCPTERARLMCATSGAVTRSTWSTCFRTLG